MDYKTHQKKKELELILSSIEIHNIEVYDKLKIDLNYYNLNFLFEFVHSFELKMVIHSFSLAFSDAFNKAIALFIVSSHSVSGTES